MFTFIESSMFERLMPIYLDDDEYAELQQYSNRPADTVLTWTTSGG